MMLSRPLVGRNIDLLRGVAALFVLFLHAREIFWIGMRAFWLEGPGAISASRIFGYASFPLVWGSIGVPVFFVLSGYCIHRGYAGDSKANFLFRDMALRFWFRRFVRIYPVLFAALIVTLILDYLTLKLLPGYVRVGDLSIRDFFVNLLALQGVVGGVFGSNGALWTLSIEIQFYIVYPFLLILIRAWGVRNVMFFVLMVNAISCIVLHESGVKVFASYWFSWYLGVLVAEGEVDKYAREMRVRLSGGVFLLVVGCILFFKLPFVAFQVWSLSFALFLGVILVVKDWSGLAVTLLEGVGKLSYSLYITHLPLLVFLSAILFRGVRQENIGWVALAGLLAIGFSYVFYLFVEKPAIDWLSKKSRRQKYMIFGS
ncbi:acyltransferase family protein [Burkholderia sp. USMB20]|uniref:acyltransferase family protein n=1 Tax=Burkholderia sp. USMB20 TaxID=1571773 RepID=UPI0005CF738A|nr:acyltransferase [Burkholderia sp. USMB20]TGN94698.1 acyltransferase [Burkholderia sp. USMB20]